MSKLLHDRVHKKAAAEAGACKSAALFAHIATASPRNGYRRSKALQYEFRFVVHLRVQLRCFKRQT